MQNHSIDNAFRLKRFQSLVPSILRHATSFDGANDSFYTGMADVLSIMDADLRKCIKEKWVTEAGLDVPFASQRYSSLVGLGALKGVTPVGYEILVDENRFCTLINEFFTFVQSLDFTAPVLELRTQIRDYLKPLVSRFEFQLDLYGRLEGEPQRCLELIEESFGALDTLIDPAVPIVDGDSPFDFSHDTFSGVFSTPLSKLIVSLVDLSATTEIVYDSVRTGIKSIPTFWQGDAWLNFSQHLFRERLHRYVYEIRTAPTATKTLLRTLALATHSDVDSYSISGDPQGTTTARCHSIESEPAFNKYRAEAQHIEKDITLLDMQLDIALTENPLKKCSASFPVLENGQRIEIENPMTYTYDRPVVTIAPKGDDLYFPSVAGVGSRELLVFGDVIRDGYELKIYPEIEKEYLDAYRSGDNIQHHDWIYRHVNSYAELRGPDVITQYDDGTFDFEAGSVEVVSHKMYHIVGVPIGEFTLAEFEHDPPGSNNFGAYTRTIKTPLFSPGTNSVVISTLAKGELPEYAQYEVFSQFSELKGDAPVFAFDDTDSPFNKAVFLKRHDIFDTESATKREFTGHISAQFDWWSRRVCSFKVTIQSVFDDPKASVPALGARKRLERPGVLDLVYNTIEKHKATGIHTILDVPEILPADRYATPKDELTVGINKTFGEEPTSEPDPAEKIDVDDALAISISYTEEDFVSIKDDERLPAFLDSTRFNFATFGSYFPKDSAVLQARFNASHFDSAYVVDNNAGSNETDPIQFNLTNLNYSTFNESDTIPEEPEPLYDWSHHYDEPEKPDNKPTVPPTPAMLNAYCFDSVIFG